MKIIYKSCKELTPTPDTTELDVANALRNLNEDLNKEIMWNRKFVAFNSEITVNNVSLKHLNHFLANLDNKSEIANFDLIELVNGNTITEHESRSISSNRPVIYYPKNIWIPKGFGRSFQRFIFRVDLLKNIISKLLETETLPWITSTEIMPIAYSQSTGLLRFISYWDENKVKGFDIPEKVQGEIIEFHRPYLKFYDFGEDLVKEYKSCRLV